MKKKYICVDDAQGLARLTQTLEAAARVGMDTEADSLHHYYEKVCLIQLSFLGGNYIIDPLRGFSLSEFLEVLSQKELIFQGADFDLRVLKKSFGFRPKAPIFDTMLAAQVLGYEKIGLAALAERFVGILMSKTGQKADWSKRPLPERLLTYASDDTQYLETIADALTENLQKLNRIAWHRECCERVVKTSGLPESGEEKESWRVKGSSELPPNELIFVRELWKWRDEEAREKDRPAFYILQNEDLVGLAGWQAQNPKSPIQEGPAFLKRFTGENRARLENALRSAKNAPPAEWPLPKKRREWATERPDQKKLEALLAACRTLAKKLGIEPSFLASRGALTAVIRHQPRSIEEVAKVSGLMHWQAELMLPEIKTLLAPQP
ncbi:MAG: HRDC domain-containing protein [Candidatus Omnitrophota bacterium]|nr:HRDC domain-containing protein [Candidatus Omnitrophota bacterium]